MSERFPQLRRILPLATAVALVVWAGCHKPSKGGAHTSKAEAARRQAVQLAEAALAGAANAQSRSLPETASSRRPLWDRWMSRGRQWLGLGETPPPELPPPAEPPLLVGVRPPEATPQPKTRPAPRPGARTVIREQVINLVPRSSEQEAEADALLVAADLLARRFAELYPPLDYTPTPGEVRQEFVRWDNRQLIRLTPGQPEHDQRLQLARDALLLADAASPTLVDVYLDIEVTAPQIRQLRSQHRLSEAILLVLILTVLCGCAYGLLRLDDWAKGYLSLWLAAIAGLIIGVAIFIWYYA